MRKYLTDFESEFKGRNVLLVDDSIVRGTTSREIVQMARDAGARKVYLASAAPPVRFPNVYGIDMPTSSELVAHGRTNEEIRDWIGCDAQMQARAVTLDRHTGEVAKDGPADLPPACTIPVPEGAACDLDAYMPGTNASIFSPQGGVRISMMDLARIGQAFGEDRAFFSDRAKESFDRAWNTSFHPAQEFFCVYGLHLQIIDSPQALWANAEQPKPATCRDELFGDGEARVGHSGEAYGLQSGLWFDLGTGRGVAYFTTEAPPPVGGEDTGGFTTREKALMARAQALLAKKP